MQSVAIPSSPSVPPPVVPSPPPPPSDPVLVQGGLTWPQNIGGYGEHFQMPEPTEEGTYNLRSRAHPSVIKERAAAHVAIMQTFEEYGPWKDEFDTIMCQVALMAQFGVENHYKAMGEIDLTKGSKDKRVLDLVGKEPKGYLRSVGCKVFGQAWSDAMEAEIGNLMRNNTYELMPLYKVQKMKLDNPTEVSLGYTHFVNKVKTMDMNGMSVLDKLKSRLVYQGNYSQRFIDWITSHAPAGKMDSFRILMSLMTTQDLYAYIGDWIGAFLQCGSPNKHMYARFPHGYKMMKDGVEQCMHLKKNLYGMVDAARNWFHTLEHWLLNDAPYKFTQMGSDQCCFWCQQGKEFMILFLYVDDMIVLTTDPSMKVKLFDAIKTKFEFEDKGELDYFLGVKVLRDRKNKRTTLDMKAYIKDKLTEFKLDGKKPYTTPHVLGDDHELGEVLQAEQATEYRSMVGALLWVCLVRPDVAHTVNKLSQSMQRPHEFHMKQAERCWQYLGGTINDCLTYSLDNASKEEVLGVGYMYMPKGGESVATGYVDANLRVPKSTTGYVFKIGGGTVVAKSKLQPITAIASYDAEYYAMSSAMLIGIWCNMFLKELTHLFEAKFNKPLINGPIVVYGDNASVVHMVQEKNISSRARHIALRWHHMMDATKAGLVEPLGISGDCNPSDILTKALDGVKTKLMREDLLGINLMDKEKGVKKPKGN